jgi:hypothetical protein
LRGIELKSVIEIEKQNLDISFHMFCNILDYFSDDFWNKRVGGFVFWQQFVHVLCGIDYWMRDTNDSYINPFNNLKIYTELEMDPEDVLSKKQVIIFRDNVANKIHEYFKDKTDRWLLEESKIEINYTNLDIVTMQIRHIQYHLGCFECYLRENNIKTQNWID